MQQVHQYRQGERDYTLIKGDTGPLVYPAVHVYIYSALYRVTDGGKDILLAQLIFGGLYLSILSVVMACYRQAKVCVEEITTDTLTGTRLNLRHFSLGTTTCLSSSSAFKAHA